MRKTITTLLILFLTLGLFAETGYNGNQWLKKRDQLILNFPIEPGEDKLWNTTAAEKKAIMGKETVVYYHYGEGYLYAVSYYTTVEKTENLKKKFNNLVYEKKTKNVTISDLICIGILRETSDIDLYLNNQMAISCLKYEQDGYDQIEVMADDNGKATISIYDYNDDTRVYILENFIEKLTFVVYTYHEQDY